MTVRDSIASSEMYSERTNLQRSPLLITALLAAIGGAMIYLLSLPALWRMSWIYGLLFTALAAAQIGAAVMALTRPVRGRVLFAAAAALILLLLWVLERFAGLIPPPDPWIPMNSAIGFTDDICAGLEITAIVGLIGAMLLPQRPRHSLAGRVIAAVFFTPVIVLVLLVTALGVNASSNGFRGAGFPADVVPPQKLPPGT